GRQERHGRLALGQRRGVRRARPRQWTHSRVRRHGRADSRHAARRLDWRRRAHRPGGYGQTSGRPSAPWRFAPRGSRRDRCADAHVRPQRPLRRKCVVRQHAAGRLAAALLRLVHDSRRAIDTVTVIARADGGRLTAESIYVRAPGLQMTGGGTFGLTEDQSGDLSLALDAPSLSQVEPVVAAFKNDSVAHFDGALHVDLTAKGWLKQYTLDLAARGHALAMNGFQVESVTVTAAGTVDSLNFGARLAIDSVTALALGGRSSGRGASVTLDSLLIERADAVWTMAQG